MSAGRTLQVRCATWEQVETFHTRKLRKGRLLSMKVPFLAEVGAPVTLNLELPNQVVVAIEGTIQKASAVEGGAGKTWIEIELFGFTDEVVARIKAMAAGASLPEDPTPPPLGPPARPLSPAATVEAGGAGGAEAAAPGLDLEAEIGAASAPLAPAGVGAVTRVEGSEPGTGAVPPEGGSPSVGPGGPAGISAPGAATGAPAAAIGTPAAVPLVPLAAVGSAPVVVAVPPVGTASGPVSGPSSAPPLGALRRPTRPPVLRRPTQPPPVPPPSGHELPSEERALFNYLTGELRRLRQLAVHEVLDVDRDADADVIRVGWMRLVRRHHPDLVARHHAPAISHLAEELTILCNRAYDRLRAALVLEGRATSVGSVLQQPAGWLVGFDDISSREASVARALPTAPDAQVPLVPPPDPVPTPVEGAGGVTQPLSVIQGGESFEARARAMLANGDAHQAQEVLAAALCVYPRSRPLRSLYYVASALGALMKGEPMLATSQLETALAHYEQCVEAAQILEHLKLHGEASHVDLRRYFQ